jgi:hypothetical protein
VYAEDVRVQELAAKHENFKRYINQFSSEFGDKLLPSLLMWHGAGPQTYRSTEALAAFRDALALSVVPRSWAGYLRWKRPKKLRFSNWFSIYPWMIDRNYEHVVMANSAVLGLHDTKLLRGQTSPGIFQEPVGKVQIDNTLHRELLVRWQRRFKTDKADTVDIRLFRSLNMANAAAQLPSQGDFTPYDSGRCLALWTSAFEILAHPGQGHSGNVQVYNLLERANWRLSTCREPRHPAEAPIADRRSRILPCAIYSRIHRARNDYLHGNRVTDVQLSVEPFGRFLSDYAAPLYRMALTGFLGLQFEEQPPDCKDVKAHDAFESRKFDYEHYQDELESAIATIYVKSGN